MRKIFLSIFMFTICFTSQAQKKTKFGIKIGANYSTILSPRNDDHYLYNFKPKTSIYIGAFIDIPRSDFYTLQPELVYSNQGAKTEYLEDGTANLHYMCLTIANKFFILKDGGLHLIIGSSIDLNLEDNFVSLGNRTTSNYFFIDFAFFGGIGYQFKSGLTLEFRYKRGIMDVFDDDYFLIFPGGVGDKNSLFQFGLAYKFNRQK